MRFKLLSAAFILGNICATAFAGNVSINGTIPGTVQLSSDNQNDSRFSIQQSEKQISFQRIISSDEAKKYLSNFNPQKNATTKASYVRTALPTSTSLGMNGVPVLDQGQHGTCVTFATTAAIDALANAAKANGSYDRYSQLCSLELGSTLEAQSPKDNTGQHTYPSGWDGSFATIVLPQMQTYGLVSTQTQKQKGCAGVYQYPLNVESDHGKPMSVSDYKTVSEKLNLRYRIILDSEEAFSPKANMDTVLQNVKVALSKKHRVTFGTLLDVNLGHNGALGTNKRPYDTWVLTPEITKDLQKGIIEAGHEMVIIGYDDNARVIGPNKDVHQGVLTLRNSWGDAAGDHGNYYMTYDHFKALSMEAAEYIKV